MVRVVQWIGVKGGKICQPRPFVHSGSHDMLLDMGPMYHPCPLGTACRTDLNCYDHET